MNHSTSVSLDDGWAAQIERFLAGGGRFSKSTISTYRPALKRFAGIALEHGVARPKDIDPGLLELYGQALTEWNPAPRTRSLHVVCVRRFVQWLKAHGASSVPSDWQVKSILPSQPVAPSTPTSTSRPDLKRLLTAETSSLRDRAIWALAAFAGLRATEIAKLQLHAFESDPSGWYVRVERGRRGLTRRVPLVGEVTRSVAAYLEDTGRSLGRSKGYLFEAEDRYAEMRGTEGLSRQTIYNVIRRTAELAGIPSCNPRELRNAFAVLFLRAGGNLGELQDLLGHDHPATTAAFIESQRRSEVRETLERQLAMVEATDETLMSRTDQKRDATTSTDE